MLACLVLVTSLNAEKNNTGTKEHWSTGYYRASLDENVYFYNDEYRWYCHVQNATQLEQTARAIPLF